MVWVGETGPRIRLITTATSPGSLDYRRLGEDPQAAFGAYGCESSHVTHLRAFNRQLYLLGVTQSRRLVAPRW